MSISMAPELDREVRQAAQRAGVSLSAWLSEAAKARLRSETLDAFFEEYQREYGAFTEEEIRAARERLGDELEPGS